MGKTKQIKKKPSCISESVSNALVDKSFNEVRLNDDVACDLMLNVVSTPCVLKSDVKQTGIKRKRGSGRNNKKSDGFQEKKDSNQASQCEFIGEVSDSYGENEKLPDGTKLKFKYAKFGKTPLWIKKEKSTARSSYKHLIKGDIVLSFCNTNLHEIKGYAVEPNRKK